MLAEPDRRGAGPVLGAIPYSHQPRAAAHRRRIRAAAPIAGRALSGTTCVTPDDDSVLVTYDVTRLMRLGGATPVPRHARRRATVSTPRPCWPR